jgi:hypothetical protein
MLLLPSLAYGNQHRATSSAPQENTRANKENTIVAPNGKIQITSPSGWATATDLNEWAELQASDLGNEIFLIVLSDEKKKYDSSMTLDLHSKKTLGTLTKGMTSVTSTSGPTTLTVNGKSALQYEVRGVTKGVDVVYLHTTVETPDNFHQVVTWTTKSTFDAKNAAIQNVIQSFKETGQ